MKLRIVCDENLAITPLLRALDASLLCKPGREIDADDVRDADVLLVRSVTRVNADLLGASAVKFVGSATAGVDHICTRDLAALGIPFCSAPGVNANAVAEYVLAAIGHAGRIGELLSGAPVGVVGYGHVGKAISHKLLALGAKVLVFDPWVDVPEGIRAQRLEDMCCCQIITLHAALHDRPPWPSRDLLANLVPTLRRQSGLLINAGRGRLLGNDACGMLLDSGWQLALDTWPEEPVIDAGLIERVQLATPHIAGYSLQAKSQATDYLVKALGEALPLDTLPERGATQTARQAVGSARIDAQGWLHEVLQANKGIAASDQGLRLAARPQVDAATFDALRRHYRLPDELAGSEVVLSSEQRSIIPLCTALGMYPKVMKPTGEID